LEAAGDHEGLSEVWNILANSVCNLSGRYLEGEHAAEQMVYEARLAGRQLIYPAILCDALLYGPRPVREALARLEDGIGARASPPESVRDPPAATLARVRMIARDARFAEARTLAPAAMDMLRERGDVEPHYWSLAEIEMLAGNDEPAEQHLLLVYDYALAHD